VEGDDGFPLCLLANVAPSFGKSQQGALPNRAPFPKRAGGGRSPPGQGHAITFLSLPSGMISPCQNGGFGTPPFPPANRVCPFPPCFSNSSFFGLTGCPCAKESEYASPPESSVPFPFFFFPSPALGGSPPLPLLDACRYRCAAPPPPGKMRIPYSLFEPLVFFFCVRPLSV